jgi:ubiquinone/menaquinone biosynthesis C-methylase UbiE
MTAAHEVYSGLSGGRVLDVGTGRGGFVDELIAELADYDEIIGIDINGDLEEGFANHFSDHPGIRFQQGDAMSLPFEDGSFDTVSVSGSLHHLSDPQLGLREMTRVLRRGGHLVAVEMYRDGQTETQQTHVMLHHWWAAIDRLSGTVHRDTYTRREVLDLVNDLDLAELTIRDETYLDEDPKAEDELAQLEASIDRYLDLAAGHPDLLARGKEIRERLRRIGVHGATVRVAMGTKRET